VIRVRRQAVEPNVVAIAAELDLSLRRFVTRLAQALQFASDECSPIAPVRSDMIDYARCGDDAALQAELAQRMCPQPQPAQLLPAPGFIEGVRQ
jgi:hypothetical protein